MKKLIIGVVSLFVILTIANTTLSFGGNTGMTSNFWKMSGGDLVPTSSNEKVKVYDLEVTNAFTLGGTATGGIDMNGEVITNIGDTGTDFGSSGQLTLASSLTVGSNILSDTADTDSLGTADKEFLNAYLGDNGKLYFGIGQDATIHRNAANELTLTASSGVTTSADLTVSGGDITLVDGGTVGIGGAKWTFDDSNDDISTTGNLIVENNAYASLFLENNPSAVITHGGTETYCYDEVGATSQLGDTDANCSTIAPTSASCPSGFIPVPGNKRYGTDGGFCVMKYEAKCSGSADGTGCNDATDSPVSQAANLPWRTTITQTEAIAACKRLGDGYHLITNAEWMTIARNIEQTTINDMDADGNLQLAGGHNDANDFGNASNPVATIDGADPDVSTCDLTKNMEDAANNYAATCQIRGTGGDGSLDADEKGFYDTGDVWAVDGYVAGGGNKSQLRTHVLSNGEVIWDLSGNVYEWNADVIEGNTNSAFGKGSSNWYEFTTLTDYTVMSYASVRPSNTSWGSTHGVGKIYADVDNAADGTTTHAFLRGGTWTHTSYAGVFALSLNGSPADTGSSIGFRCVR